MYLAIDTISSVSGITVFDKNTSCHHDLNPQMASEGIIEVIDKTLKKAGVNLSELQAVFVIKGPGSFTGLRVGISVANQFSHQLKIPIIGLRTDEWWQIRTPDDIAYLQSMNHSEIYEVRNSKVRILPAEELPASKWLGQLTQDHKEKLGSDFIEIKELLPIEETWQKVMKNYLESAGKRKEYNLIEPFYGKEPNITKSKKRYIIKS